MNPGDATDCRFIKLGGKGEWEAGCIEQTPGTIRLGFNNPHHEACLAGDWETVTKFMRTERKKTKGKATEITNQVRDFYTLDKFAMWITFYRRQLYWCFASPKVVKLKDGSRIRKTIGGWKNTSVGGNRLFVETLNGALTKTQGFRGTICSVGAFEYLKLRLSDEVLPEVQLAQERLRELEVSLVALICGLNWKDFELLCDLIFANAGWQRIASLGGTEKSVDLDLISPVTGRRLFVQVKSQSSKETFQAYLQDFDAHEQYDEMYFIVHSPKGDVSSWTKDANSKVKIYVAEDIARLTVSAGLTEWLLRKCS
ncbi:restriction endonuclease [Rosistilla oblonga]|uniref:restriction endonuclease n=1 Tax=Rosistilla oblonga TaxID=2527990 RepID=UPI003A9876E6